MDPFSLRYKSVNDDTKMDDILITLTDAIPVPVSNFQSNVTHNYSRVVSSKRSISVVVKHLNLSLAGS